MSTPNTRTAILDTAVELASVRGLEELSIGGLASTVQMSKSGLFAHFGSKQELQLATVAEAWEIFKFDVLRELGDDRQGVLRGLLDRWLSFYEREVFVGGCFFIVSAVELAGREDAVSKALADVVDRQLAVLETAISSAVESGELPAGKDPGRTAVALHSVLVNADSLFKVRRDRAVFDGARATIDEFLAN
ncbi:MAG: TetR/AcrR family transcriptional regulator [Actinomycetota bacterium]|nr:TetR/AcrR family transcriptional regulator [Actinomycetota bacterium]